MNKNRFRLLIILLVLTLIMPFGVSAKDIDRDKIINSIVPDGANLTIKGIEPTTYDEAYSMMMVITSKIDKDAADAGYEAYGDCNPNNFNECTIEVSDGKGWHQSYPINVTYDKPSASDLEKYGPIINNFLSGFGIDFMDPSTYFVVEDLSIINYFLTSDKSELWNPGAASRAIKFSDANNLTGGADITYDLVIGLGEQGEELMYETAGGGMAIYYNNYMYGYTNGGIYLRRVIYIPESTADTPDAYIAAAKKRIDNYLGENDITITLGGALNTLAANLPTTSAYYGSNYQDLLDEYVDESETDGNYYNIKIGNRTYKFYILKSEDIPENPVYNGYNIGTDVSINSTDSSIPLDTSVTVKKVDDNKLKAKIGTDNYVSYDINLYSEAKNAKIEKLDNGLFRVSIPVPEDLKDKTLTVYYIDANGKIEEHEVTPIDGYAIFETDHFSTYTLAEKVDLPEEESNVESSETVPKTLDDVTTYISLLVISICGIAITYKLANKNN